MVDLTLEQQDVVRGIVTDVTKKSKQVVTFGGVAGCGKTTCVTFLAEVLDEFAICAFTGKAASVLRKKGLLASTIHSLIYEAVKLPNGQVEFNLKEPSRLSCKGFIVDEASTVSKDIYNDLLSFGMPVIFIGDHCQLEPVGQDAGVMANPQYRLETIHRNAGEIAYFGEHLRKGNRARAFQGGDKVCFKDTSEVTDDLLCSQDQVICAFNRFRAEMNDRVRKAMGCKKLIEVGEKVICLKNNSPVGLFNGMQGHVVKVGRGNKFDFLSNDVLYQDISYDSRQFGKEKNVFEFGDDMPNPFDYAYFLTAHKSQGDEWSKVMVYEQECNKWSHQRWAYTAATRAKEKLIWVSPRQYVPSWL